MIFSVASLHTPLASSPHPPHGKDGWMAYILATLKKIVSNLLSSF